MSDAPERIWVRKHPVRNKGHWHDATNDKNVAETINGAAGTMNPFFEYVRADIHRNLALDAIAAETQAAEAYDAQLKADAMAAKLAEALAWARNLLEPFADPELSLGLGEMVIPKIDAAIAEYLDNR